MSTVDAPRQDQVDRLRPSAFSLSRLGFAFQVLRSSLQELHSIDQESFDGACFGLIEPEAEA
jgi:hypothetical protein